MSEPRALTPRAIITHDPELLPLRATATTPTANGKDLAFFVIDHAGNPVWCKADNGDFPTRATECVAAQLGMALGIRTASWRRVEYRGEEFFGSQNVIASSVRFSLRAYLMSERRDIYGGSTLQRGTYLGGVVALDMFLHNPDRHLDNFILVNDESYRRLCVIDYGDADIGLISSTRFPVAGSNTVELGRATRAIHGGFQGGANDLLDKIEAFSPDAFRQIVQRVPAEWMPSRLKDDLNVLWGSEGFHRRLAALRAGIDDGTLV